VLDQTLSSHSRITKHATFSRMNANQLSQDTTHIYHYSVAMDIQERNPLAQENIHDPIRQTIEAPSRH
jgi:hypothetical protein